MPDSTSLAADTHRKIRSGATAINKDDKPQLSRLERIQPGGILGGPVLPDLVPFGLDRLDSEDDHEPA
jgi:hypothetical protein